VADDVPGALAARVELPGGSRLVGIRDLVHDRDDPRWLERPDVLRGLRAVARAGLVFDLLVRPPQMPSAVVAVDAVPEGRFVLDHGGKPLIEAGVMEPWSKLAGELARRPNVMCKFSGLVTEAGQGWREDLIRPYTDKLIEYFGPERLIFGSDWPVCTAVAEYRQVVALAWSLIDALSPDEQAEVMAGNAVATYGLDVVQQ
jgi:L-fuconolactonase